MHRTKTLFDIRYEAGGNPPIAAGLFTDDNERLAWWPAGVPATQANIERVVKELVWKREDDEPVGREAILAALAQGVGR